MVPVRGVVSPRYLTLPDGVASLRPAEEALAFGREIGLDLDEYQEFVLRGALGERADGRWAASTVVDVEPRQNGKNETLTLRQLAGLVLWGESLQIHTAHKFDTAKEHAQRVFQIVEENERLDRLVKHIHRSNQETELRFKDGARLRFLARGTGGGRGFAKAQLIVLDEAMRILGGMLGAIIPTMSASAHRQLWVLSSAPLETPESDELRRICIRGRAGAPRMAYFEACADPDDDPHDERTWAKANPAYGRRIFAEAIEDELTTMSPEEFEQERLGIWNDDEDADLVIPAAAWAACCDHKSGPVGRLEFALDVDEDRAHASFAVAAVSPRGGTHVEIVDYRPGTEWVVARAVELQARWGGSLVLIARSPAASLRTELEQARVRVVEASSAQHLEACGGFYDAVVQGQIRHHDQTSLNIAVRAAERKYSGDAWVWDRRSSLTDISPLVAVTMARWLLEQPEANREVFVAWG